MPDELQNIVNDLFSRVAAYRRILNEYAELERKGERLSTEDERKREFTPANLIYANGNQFRVERLNFYILQAKDKNFKTGPPACPVTLSMGWRYLSP